MQSQSVDRSSILPPLLSPSSPLSQCQQSGSEGGTRRGGFRWKLVLLGVIVIFCSIGAGFIFVRGEGEEVLKGRREQDSGESNMGRKLELHQNLSKEGEFQQWFRQKQNSFISDKRRKENIRKQALTLLDSQPEHTLDNLPSDTQPYLSSFSVTQILIISSLKTLIFLSNPFLVNFTNSNLPLLQTLIINSTNFQLFSNLSFGNLKTLQIINSSLQNNTSPLFDPNIKNVTLMGNNFTTLNLSKWKKLENLVVNDKEIQELAIDGEALEDVELLMDGLVKLNICGTKINNLNKIQTPKLKQLTVKNTQIQTLINCSFASLQTLELIDNNLLEIAGNKFNSLQNLSIIDTKTINIIVSVIPITRQMYVNIQTPQLISLTLTLTPFSIVTLFAPYIVQLQLTNAPTDILVSMYRTLKRLTLSNVVLIDTSSLYFPALEYLSIVNSNLTAGYDFKAPNLQYLNLHTVNISTLDISMYSGYWLQLYLNLPTLIQFYANNNTSLDDITFSNLSLPSLRTLQLSHTSLTTFTQTSSNFPLLKSLTIGIGLIESITLTPKQSHLNQLIIQENPLDNLTATLAPSVKILSINIPYFFFNQLTLYNFEVSSFHEINVHFLQSMVVRGVNFYEDEPFGNGMWWLKNLRVENSNLKVFNVSKFPKLDNRNFINCPNVEFIDEGNTTRLERGGQEEGRRGREEEIRIEMTD